MKGQISRRAESTSSDVLATWRTTGGAVELADFDAWAAEDARTDDGLRAYVATTPMSVGCKWVEDDGLRAGRPARFVMRDCGS